MSQVSNVLNSLYDLCYVSVRVENGKAEIQLPKNIKENSVGIGIKKLNFLEHRAKNANSFEKETYVFYDKRSLMQLDDGKDLGSQEKIFKEFLFIMKTKKSDFKKNAKWRVYCISLGIYDALSHVFHSIEVLLFSKHEFSWGDNSYVKELLKGVMMSEVFPKKVLKIDENVFFPDYMTWSENFFEFEEEYVGWKSIDRPGQFAVTLGFFCFRVEIEVFEENEKKIMSLLFDLSSNVEKKTHHEYEIKFESQPRRGFSGGIIMKGSQFVSELSSEIGVANVFGLFYPEQFFEEDQLLVVFGCLGNFFYRFCKVFKLNDVDLSQGMVFHFLQSEVLAGISDLTGMSIDRKRNFSRGWLSFFSRYIEKKEYMETKLLRVCSDQVLKSAVVREGNFCHEGVLYQGPFCFGSEKNISEVGTINLVGLQDLGQNKILVLKFEIFDGFDSKSFLKSNVSGVLVAEFLLVYNFDPLTNLGVF